MYRAHALIAMLAAAACGAAEPARVVDSDVYLHASRLVAIERGRRLNLHCVGKGSPAVIFESGLTEPTSTWGLVQPAVGETTRACAYDRAGVGFSDPLTRAATSENIVDDLHRLLRAASIRPPYVIVGHSYGGMNARLYAATYPREIAGIVLVDPSHEDQTEGYRKLDPRGLSVDEWRAQTIEPGLARRRECVAAAERGELVPGADVYKKCGFVQYAQLSDRVRAANIAFQMAAPFQRAQLSEEENVFGASAESLRAAPPLPRVRLIVLTQGPPPAPAEPLPPEKQALREARYAMWVGLHARLAAQSARGEQRIVEGSGHNIPLERPQAVIDAILEMTRR